MLEIAPEDHGPGQNNILKYIEDSRNFIFFVNEAKKFGFMVDKNAPWRLVFNLASGEKVRQETGKLSGAQLYMEKKAVNFNNVFETYYRKAYLDEHFSLKSKLLSLYESFYLQYGTYETIKYVVCSEESSNSTLQSSFSLSNQVAGRVKIVRQDREPLPAILGTIEETNEYWLKILLKLRLSETDTIHDSHNFNFYATEAIRLNRLFGLETGLKYINDLTRGFHVSNFLSKGSFWYGISQEEYEDRRREVMKNAEDPSRTNYSLTGTKNVK
jgi:hypothetical protein